MVAFGLGYGERSKEIVDLEKKVLDEETARKLAENVATELKDNAGKSDYVVIRGIFKMRRSRKDSRKTDI